MKIYFAPMEGVTTAVYRRVHRKHFGGVDRYFTPFLAATGTHHFKKRERQEIDPFQGDLVPQILCTCSAQGAEDFLWALHYAADLGYPEVNLNLGCPAATVVTKHKGAGMLEDPEKLDRFFDAVFARDPAVGISLKIRLGLREPEEADRLATVYQQYPFSEIIIHPRVREDYYGGEVRLGEFERLTVCLNPGFPESSAAGIPGNSAASRGFASAAERAREDLQIIHANQLRTDPQIICEDLFRAGPHIVYNGDIRTPADAAGIAGRFPWLDTMMIGRGLIANPALAREIQGGAPFDRAEMRDFLKDLWEAYSETLYGERDVLFKMKELWSYMGPFVMASMPGDDAPVNESNMGDAFGKSEHRIDRALLDIKKCKTGAEYDLAVGKLLAWLPEEKQQWCHSFSK